MERGKRFLRRLWKWIRAVIALPVVAGRIERSLQIHREHSAVGLTRLIHRMDALSRSLEPKDRSRPINNVQTLLQYSDLEDMIAEGSGSESYSQYGEDVAIKILFSKIGIEQPSYLDIGAHHPTFLSNTALLYRTGSRGVNIEANPYLLKAFEDMRPHDANVNCGVGPTPGNMRFHIIDDDPTLSTFDPAQLVRLSDLGKVSRTSVDVELLPISEVVKRHCAGVMPDFLSIDIEGMDYEVLKTVDYKDQRPAIICVEINTHGTLSRIVEIEFLLFAHGYFHLGDVGGGIQGRNALFVDDRYYQRLSSAFDRRPEAAGRP